MDHRFEQLYHNPAPPPVVQAMEFYGNYAANGVDSHNEFLRCIQSLMKDIRVNLMEALAEKKFNASAFFCSICLHESGMPVPQEPYHVDRFLHYGSETTEPMYGDLCLFSSGLVGWYFGETDNTIFILTALKNEQIAITQQFKSHLITARKLNYQFQYDRRKIEIK